jgi:transposase
LFKKEDISIFTGVSVRSVERILLYYSVHGTVHDSAESEQRGKRRHLRDLDVEVSSSVTRMFLAIIAIQFLLGTVRRTPDLYLDELQEMLSTTCGVTVSQSTVWRTLRKAGFTLKKVSIYVLVHKI